MVHRPPLPWQSRTNPQGVERGRLDGKQERALPVLLVDASSSGAGYRV
jgi:hypothetical protein